jgi:hypothetical protein
LLPPNTFVYITPDLTITTKEVARVPEGSTFAAVTPGADPRFLFLKADNQAFVVDGQGNGVSIVSTAPASWRDTFVAGASASGFLAVHKSGSVVFAERLDRDGQLIAHGNSGLPIPFLNGSESIAGGDDGFIFVQRLSDGSITAYLLDANGVYKGIRVELAPNQNLPLNQYPTAPTAVVRESDRYLVLWQAFPAHVTDMLAEIRPDGSASIRTLTEWPVTGGGGIAIASALGKRIVASSVRTALPTLDDVYTRTLTPTLTANDPQLVTQGATAQASAQVAGGANGFAVVWTEAGMSDILSVYLRRFSPSGQAQGPPQLVANVPYTFDPTRFDLSSTGNQFYLLPGARLASNGDTYVVGWQTPDGFVVRRMAAATGAWMDAQPALLPKQFWATLASNGHDAVAASIDACATGSADRCLFATRIPMSGDLGALAPAATIPAPAHSGAGVALASDGTEYLAAWTNPYDQCGDISCWAHQDIFGVRLRTDATPINASPIVLPSDPYAPLYNVALYWQGDRYLLSWSAGGRSAAQFSSQAMILSQGGYYNTIPGCCNVAAPLGRYLALFFGAGTSVADARWESAIVPINANRIDILTAPHTKLLPIVPMPFIPSFVVASRGTTLAVVYNHFSGDETGRAQRLYFRLFAVPTPARTRPVNPY